MTDRRRLSALGWSALLWILSYLGARLLLERGDLALPLRMAIAAMPVPPFAWFLLTLGRQLRELDELERRIQLEALAFAFPLALLLLMALGLFELAGPLPPEDLSYRHVWAYLPMFYFLGLAIAWRRYR